MNIKNIFINARVIMQTFDVSWSSSCPLSLLTLWFADTTFFSVFQWFSVVNQVLEPIIKILRAADIDCAHMCHIGINTTLASSLEREIEINGSISRTDTVITMTWHLSQTGISLYEDLWQLSVTVTQSQLTMFESSLL